MSAPKPYSPPRPKPMGPLASLVRVMMQGDGDLLGLMPASAYHDDIGPLGYSRRSIWIVNDPALTRPILYDDDDLFPKNDLMVGALAPLVGNSMFVSSGAVWRKQRAMIDPAFSHMRLAKAFPAMQSALDDFTTRLRSHSGPISLDLAMGQLTADIICRTVFSASLADETARDVFESFAYFERTVANVEIMQLIFGRPFDAITQKPDVLAACARIRTHIGNLLDRHLEKGARFDDIAARVIDARDLDSGTSFTRDELIDQLGVFFLAGHETTASGLTWALFIAAQRPDVAERVRHEVRTFCGGGAIGFEQVKKLTYTRNVFKETLRLYPPITFIPRVAAAPTQIGHQKIKRGAMIMISPWAIHRHQKLWREPDVFDPDRFAPDRETEIIAGAYLPFGQGPRVCVGAAFATTEATLILAQLLRDFDFHIQAPEKVRPIARLTTRPADEIMMQVKPRHD
ncbi:MAG: cytochrome P450 [Hyphomonadaceae bacterium]|nr:cytochrome P450 [Hyphomonadaceae bacterium]